MKTARVARLGLVRAVLMLLFVGLFAADGRAQTACDELLNRLLVDWKAAGKEVAVLDQGFSRLAELELQYGPEAIEKANALFKSVELGQTTSVLEQYFAKRQLTETYSILTGFGRFSDDAARRGFAKIASLDSSIDPGARLLELLADPKQLPGQPLRITDDRRAKFLQALDKLIPAHGSPTARTSNLVNRVTKAARNNDAGGLYEAYASVEIQETGEFGLLESVDVDFGGANEELNAVDSLTSTHVLQMKTTDDATLPLSEDGVTVTKLQALIDQGQKFTPVRLPVVVSPVPLSVAAAEKCAEMGIPFKKIEF